MRPGIFVGCLGIAFITGGLMQGAIDQWPRHGKGYIEVHYVGENAGAGTSSHEVGTGGASVTSSAGSGGVFDAGTSCKKIENGEVIETGDNNCDPRLPPYGSTLHEFDAHNGGAGPMPGGAK